jgi:adenylyltransferase/sulfurtransferase
MSIFEDEKNRFSRQIAVPELGVAGQERLSAAKVLMVGAGGLGNPALVYLAAAGVGQIGIVDGDRVEYSNLHRQILCPESSCGRAKVDVAAETLQARNQRLKLERYETRLTFDNVLDIARGYDLVLDGSDNFATRYLVNDACVALSKTFVASSIYQFEGQLSVFNHDLGGKRGPTYRCLFPEPPPADTVPNCSELGVIGTVPGILGILQAHEAVKLLAGFGEPLVGRLLIFNLLDLTTREIRFARSSHQESLAGMRTREYYDGLAGICQTKEPHELSASELHTWRNSGRPLYLLDVRESSERDAFSLGGIHIPLGQLSGRLREIPSDVPVVVYCHSGVRSKHAAKMIMDSQSRRDVSNLTGGVVAWRRWQIS